MATTDQDDDRDRRRERDVRAVVTALLTALRSAGPGSMVRLTVGAGATPRPRVRLQGCYDLRLVAERAIGALDLARAPDVEPETEVGWEEDPAPLAPEPTATHVAWG